MEAIWHVLYLHNKKKNLTHECAGFRTFDDSKLEFDSVKDLRRVPIELLHNISRLVSLPMLITRIQY